ncbi:HEPN domain-containing protein [bacterium]|nr:HEPN domain-containing protein [bacterium]
MNLTDWLNNGWLVEHRTSSGEIADLLSAADLDLNNSAVPGVDPEWQLIMAYTAALRLAMAALAASGFRPSRESGHYRTIGSLALTIGAEKALVDKFDAFRKKRNISQYDSAGLVSEKEAEEMKALALELKSRVTEWLKTNHPEMLPEE